MPAASAGVASRPAAARSAGRWSPKEAAEYAAHKEFILCQLLATDRRAFAVARRLRSVVAAESQSGKAAVPVQTGGAQQQEGGAAPARPPNHSQRRSAARSAKKHAEMAAAAAAAAPAAAPTAPPPGAASSMQVEDEARAPTTVSAAATAPPPPRASASDDASSSEEYMSGDDRPLSPSRAAREEHALLRDASAQLASRSQSARQPTMDELMRAPIRNIMNWDGEKFNGPPR